MQAIRAGFKRIDNKKNRGRKGKESADLPTDRSAWPILEFEDSNETSPGKTPITWDPYSFEDDTHQFSHDSIPTPRSRSVLQHIAHKNSASGTTKFSIERLPSYESASRATHPTSWQPVVLHDENTPPITDHSRSKFINSAPKWKKMVHIGESIRPLLSESLTDSAKVQSSIDQSTPKIVNKSSKWHQNLNIGESHRPLLNESFNDVSKALPITAQLTPKFFNEASQRQQKIHVGDNDRSQLSESFTDSSKALLAHESTSPPRNLSRWQPIEEDDESSKPPRGRYSSKPMGIISSRHKSRPDPQLKNHKWKHKAQQVHDEDSDRSILVNTHYAIYENFVMSKFETQSKNLIRKRKDQQMREGSITGPLLLNSKRAMHESPVTFDPFDDTGNNEVLQNSRNHTFQQNEQFDTRHHGSRAFPTENLRPFPTENPGSNQGRQRSKEQEKLRQHPIAQTSHEFDQRDNGFENESLRESHNHSFQRPRDVSGRFASESSGKHLEEEIVNFKQDEFSKKRSNDVQESLKIFEAEKISSTSNIAKRQKSQGKNTLRLATDSSSQRENEVPSRDTRNHGNNFFRIKESAKASSVKKENLCFETVHEDSANRIDSNDTRLVIREVIEEKSSLKNIMSLGSAVESNYLKADLNRQEEWKNSQTRNSTTAFSSNAVKKDWVQNDLRFVALVSTFSGTLKQRAEQERTMSILIGSKISTIDKVDGSLKSNEDRRNKLFNTSGERGKYPQFFLQKGKDIIIYLGDFEWLQYMNDIGSLTDDTIFGVSRSTSMCGENAQVAEVHNIGAEDSPADPNFAYNHRIMKNLPSASDKTIALEIFKSDLSKDGMDYSERSEKLSYAEDEEMSLLNFETNSIPLELESDTTSIQSCLVESEPRDIQSPSSDIEIIDVEEIANSKNVSDIYSNGDLIKESEPSSEHIQLANTDDPQFCTRKRHNALATTEPVYDATDETSMGTAWKEKARRPESPMDDNQCIIEASPSDLSRGQSDNVSISTSQQQKKGRRTMLKSVGSLLDDDVKSTEELQCISQSFSSTTMNSETISTCNSEISHSYRVADVTKEGNYSSTSTEDDLNGENCELSIDSKQSYRDIEPRENALSLDVPPHRKNEIDTCSDFEKPELPRVGRDEEDKKKAIEIEGRRKRWKHGLSQNFRRKSIERKRKSLSRDPETPIGASLDELEMINTFMNVLGPNFGGPLSAKELESVYERSQKAGLTKEFTDRMLDESAGILMWEKKTEPDMVSNKQDSPSVTTFQMNHNTASQTEAASSIVGELYDDEGFTRKTPKEQSKIDCLVNTFWADSSNIIGGEMIENIQAALSKDNESMRGWRSVDIMENPGDSVDHTETESGQRFISKVEKFKSVEKTSWVRRGWRSTNVIKSIKAAIVGDRENNARVWSLGKLIGNGTQDAPNQEIESNNFSEKLQPSYLVETVPNDSEGLHEC